MGKAKCTLKARLDGKTAVVTGGNNGIGYETSLELLRRGARVVIACRSLERGNAAAERMRAEVSGAQVRVVHIDLASLKSVKQCAEELLTSESAIQLLINNAGRIVGTHEMTEDGYEMTFQTNHLGHFLFTRLLLSKIKDSAPAKIINVSSQMHAKGVVNFDDLQSTKSYNAFTAYAQSKLCNILFTLELEKCLKDTGVTVYALDPGTVNTKFVDDVPGLFGTFVSHIRWAFKTPAQGARTTLHCALLDESNGLFYRNCKLATPSSRALDKESAHKLWQVSEKLVHRFL